MLLVNGFVLTSPLSLFKHVVGTGGAKVGSMKTTTFEYVLPAYWASALINGDFSGLSSEESTALKLWHADHADMSAVDCGEQYFSWHNDATKLGGDVCDYTFIRA